MSNRIWIPVLIVPLVIALIVGLFFIFRADEPKDPVQTDPTDTTIPDSIVIEPDYDFEHVTGGPIVDFDEGSADFNYKYAFESFGNVIVASKDAELATVKADSEAKYAEATETIASLQSEIDGLKTYRKSKMDEERKNAEDELFAKFEELVGIQAFEDLRGNCAEMSIEDIESKCYEIKGRNTATTNFSVNKPKSTRIPVEKNKYENEPYGGLFVQFPPTNI